MPRRIDNNKTSMGKNYEWSISKKELSKRFHLNCPIFFGKVVKDIVTWPLYTAANAAPQAGCDRKCVKMYHIHYLFHLLCAKKIMYIPYVIYSSSLYISYLSCICHICNIIWYLFAIFVYFIVVYLSNTFHHNQSCLHNPTSTSWRSSSAKATTAFKAW